MSRGKSYDMKKIMELYDFGLKPAEIAAKMKIASVQSLRHAIERKINDRRIDEKIQELMIERKRAKEAAERESQAEEMRRKQESEREEIERMKMPAASGIFPYVIDDRTFKMLRYVIMRIWGNRFPIDSKDMEIYVPQSIDIHYIREKLRLAGFYMRITKNKIDAKKPLKV
ncbi:hypothetical protein DMB44_09055 [Thermoplasma sp. Kam2015]|uniref:hypothetical protein n=1 Tax=Thermoplasma sp. Kam2015 TaxID=2094122 RepID=UPI000D957DEF|nr:hypothetical protein [Thermoplasma sp. Kam2015]PYB67470.1 hypothetical protein DMB44_09055 [Thermoplasma sp. Kam2015]